MSNQQQQHIDPFPSFGTLALHAGQEPEKFPSWAVVAPISMSTTFKQSSPGVHKGHEYSRGGNPTRDTLEAQFAAICSGKHAITWGSGLAGTNAVLQLLHSGDHVVAMNDLYGGTNRLLRRVGIPNGLQIDFVDATSVAKVEAALRPDTKLVWVESPTNPLLQVCDIRGIAAAIRRRSPQAIYVVDNTFMSSYFQRPLELGADIEFASVTKYYNGHSDVCMGVTIMRDDKLHERLRFLQFAAGAIPSPFDSYLVNRGLKTLHVRMEAHQRNAFSVAHFLRASGKVISVNFPGLEDHPNHAIAKSQSTGFSGMISFRIKGGLQAAKTFLSSCQVFVLAESLGCVESLCEHPAIMTHASIAKEEREAIGIYDDLVRLSVGIENVLDLLMDLEQALNKALPGPCNANPRDFIDVLDRVRASNGYVAPEPRSVALGHSAANTAAAAAASSPAAANPNARGRVIGGTMPHPSARFENTGPVHRFEPSAPAAAASAAAAPAGSNPNARGRVIGGTMPHPAARFENQLQMQQQQQGNSSTRVNQAPGGTSTFTLG